MIRFVNTPPASVPTPPADRTTLFVDDTGQPSFKDDTGTVYMFSGESVPKGYIDGLKMEWVSGTQIRLTSGNAYIPSIDRALQFPSALTKSPTLAANTWYHGYVFLNGTTPDVEWVTTAPATAYSGTARTKTGDNSRRYIGSFRTNPSGQIFNFKHSPVSGMVLYRNKQDSYPFRALELGRATTATVVSLSAVLPVTADSGQLRLFNNNTTTPSFYSTPDSSENSPPFGGIAALGGGGNAYIPFPVDGSQAVSYWNNSSPPEGEGSFIDVYGYYYER